MAAAAAPPASQPEAVHAATVGHRPPDPKHPWTPVGQDQVGQDRQVVAAGPGALLHRPHPHLGRHQHVVEPQQRRERPAVARPGGRPAAPAPLVGVVEAQGQQPRQAPVPAGGVDVAGHHHHRVALAAHRPGQPGQLSPPALPVGPERRHRVDRVQAQPAPRRPAGCPQHRDPDHLHHLALGQRNHRFQRAGFHAHLIPSPRSALKGRD
jgi:hypothetical protein